jgi:very-short-patch-repair endonuclease
MKEKIVLIGVLKDRRDLHILLKKLWYRIPILHSPKRKPDFVAFYEPARFSKSGGFIRYYGKIKNIEIAKRKNMLPDEYDHPMADEDYYKISFHKIEQLPKPIRNKNKMRISFGFTTIDRLLSAKNIAQLFSINPIEDILFNELKLKNLNFSREHLFSLKNSRRYRLDFAIFCKKGNLNIECDSQKWHSLKRQKSKDKLRDRVLQEHGWAVLRLKEKEIMSDITGCVHKILKNIKKLGGL